MPRFITRLCLIFMFALPMLVVRPTATHARYPPPAAPNSTLSAIGIYPLVASGKTDIAIAACADVPSFQFRSEQTSVFLSQIFVRATKCPIGVSGSWRAVTGAVPGECFTLSAFATETALAEAGFTARAARYSVCVTALGVLSPPQRQSITAPTGAIDTPANGATLQGTIPLSGWAIDAASWSGPGVDQVQVYTGETLLGTATYGQARSDIATNNNDSRYTNSGYTYQLDTTRLTNGDATLRVRYHSTVTGEWSTVDRAVTIANQVLPTNQPPNPPTLVAPTNGATVTTANMALQVQDAGDPDNGPNPSRSFSFRIAKTDNSWAQESGLQASASWAITLPGAGTYQWQAQSNDGAASSAVNGPWSVIYAPPPPPDTILNVRYVDQVFAQRTPRNGWWVFCGPSSLAMVLNYYGVEKRDVFTDRAPTAELATEMRVDGRGTPAGAIPAALKKRGLAFIATKGALSAEAIRASITAGHPVMISLISYNHILLITGYRANGNFVVHDPFGGRFWPTTWSASAKRNDVPWKPPFDTPRTQGATLPSANTFIEYSYGELAQMGFNWTLRVTGATQPLAQTSAQIDPTNSIFTGQQIQVRFGKPGSIALSASTPLSVTYTPQLVSAQPVESYAGAIAVFRFTATDASAQPVSALDEAFTIQLDLDPGYVDSWVNGGGVTGGNEQDAAPPLDTTRPITQGLVLAIWDTAKGIWTELPTAIDPTTHQAIAQSSSFGDYALLVRANPTIIYLPLIKR